MSQTTPARALLWSNQQAMTAEISRQVFVRGALGVAAIAMLASCQSPISRPLATPTTPAAAPDWAAPGRVDRGHDQPAV
jgi:uncharacterized lipoprotein YajG